MAAHYYIIIDNSNLGYATQAVSRSRFPTPDAFSQATLPMPSSRPTPDPYARAAQPTPKPAPSGNLDGEDIILVVAVVAIVYVCVTGRDS